MKIFFIFLLSIMLLAEVPTVAGQNIPTDTAKIKPVPEEKIKTSAGFTGQIMATTNGDYIFLNAGGPTITFKYKKIALIIGMFPSVRFNKDLITTTLGTGFQLSYKHFLLGVPFYNLGTPSKLQATGGIGYKF